MLVIYPTRRDSLIVEAAERVLTQRLAAAFGIRTDYYTEYLDPERFPDPDKAMGETPFTGKRAKASAPATAPAAAPAAETAMFTTALQNMKILAEGGKLPPRGAKPGGH